MFVLHAVAFFGVVAVIAMLVSVVAVSTMRQAQKNRRAREARRLADLARQWRLAAEREACRLRPTLNDWDFDAETRKSLARQR